METHKKSKSKALGGRSLERAESQTIYELTGGFGVGRGSLGLTVEEEARGKSRIPSSIAAGASGTR